MKPREVMKKLKDAGWTEDKGARHTITAVSPDGCRRVPISNHPAEDIPTGTLRSIERMTGVKLA